MTEPREISIVADEKATVASVRRALHILQVVAERGNSGMTELAEELGVHKSTVSRLVATLVEEEFLERDMRTRRVTLGLGVLRLSGSVGTWAHLIQLARPILESLAWDTGATVNVGALSGGLVIHVDQVSDPGALATINWVGKEAPLHCTSMGKVLLAFSPPDVRARLTKGPLEAATPRTITDLARLQQELDNVLRRGVGHSFGEFEIGLNGISAPIRREGGAVIAAVCVSGPAFVLGPHDVPRVERAVRTAAEAISRKLGASGSALVSGG